MSPLLALELGDHTLLPQHGIDSDTALLHGVLRVCSAYRLVLSNTIIVRDC